MIEKLDNKNINISKKIHSIFQVSYTNEAKLLNVTDFPPLNRTVENFLSSDTEFYGFRMDKGIIAVVEIKSDNYLTHIVSLVVDPKFFRQGIAQKLITFVLESNDSKTITVDTAIDNIPACNLYKKFDFNELRQWVTDDRIKIIRFEKKTRN